MSVVIFGSLYGNTCRALALIVEFQAGDLELALPRSLGTMTLVHEQQVGISAETS
jgi:hypothetical protein